MKNESVLQRELKAAGATGSQPMRKVAGSIRYRHFMRVEKDLEANSVNNAPVYSG